LDGGGEKNFRKKRKWGGRAEMILPSRSRNRGAKKRDTEITWCAGTKLGVGKKGT